MSHRVVRSAGIPVRVGKSLGNSKKSFELGDIGASPELKERDDNDMELEGRKLIEPEEDLSGLGRYGPDDYNSNASSWSAASSSSSPKKSSNRSYTGTRISEANDSQEEEHRSSERFTDVKDEKDAHIDGQDEDPDKLSGSSGVGDSRKSQVDEKVETWRGFFERAVRHVIDAAIYLIGPPFDIVLLDLMNYRNIIVSCQEKSKGLEQSSSDGSLADSIDLND